MRKTGLDLEIDNDKFERKPLRLEVYSFIKDAIIKGHLKPGQRITELDLVTQLGISRTPIREALMRLENEGLVTIDPGRGALVSEISRPDLDEIYPIVASLEGLVARLATSSLSETDIHKLERLNKRMARAAKAHDVAGFKALNSEFHQKYLENCPNQRLRNLLSSYKDQIYRFRMISLSMPDRMKHSVLEHGEIVRAFRKGNENQAERLVRQHVERGRQSLERILDHVATPIARVVSKN